MARTGLRMMPTFPPLSLKSRTAGFPQYGFKADISDGAFPSTTRSARRAVCLRPSCIPLPVTSDLVLSRETRCADAPPFKRPSRLTPGVLAPVRVIVSRSIIAYSTPCAPLTGTSRFRRRAVYTPCPRCASSQPRLAKLLMIRGSQRIMKMCRRGITYGYFRGS